MQIGAGDANIVIPLEGVIDIAARPVSGARRRGRSQIARRAAEQPAFVEKAKPEAVEKARADHAHHSAEAERLASALARLG
jgi:valyl-tRNA synthetase